MRRPDDLDLRAIPVDGTSFRSRSSYERRYREGGALPEPFTLGSWTIRVLQPRTGECVNASVVGRGAA